MIDLKGINGRMIESFSKCVTLVIKGTLLVLGAGRELGGRLRRGGIRDTKPPAVEEGGRACKGGGKGVLKMSSSPAPAKDAPEVDATAARGLVGLIKLRIGGKPQP